MLEIWGRRNSSNVIPVMWTVGELGLAHRRHRIGGTAGGLDSADYRAMNPNGLVPTIKDGGFVLWESNAIVRYLSARYGEGSLWPSDMATRALADQWMDWCKTTAFPLLFPIFWTLVRIPEGERDMARVAEKAARLAEVLAILDRHLAGHAFVAGETLTMGDIPLGAMAYRYDVLDFEKGALPHMAAWYARLCERPAFREHVMFDFGRTPEEWAALER